MREEEESEEESTHNLTYLAFLPLTEAAGASRTAKTERGRDSPVNAIAGAAGRRAERISSGCE